METEGGTEVQEQGATVNTYHTQLSHTTVGGGGGGGGVTIHEGL